MIRTFMVAIWLTWFTMAHAQTDVLRLYDGLTGVACLKYNIGANLSWDNLGGDWIDAAGKPQGTQAFTSQALRLGQTGKVTLDVTRIGPEIMLRFVGAPVAIHSRETNIGPVLIVTGSDGSLTRLKADADATLDPVYPGTDGKLRCASINSKGMNITLQQAGAVISFEPPQPGYRKLELELTLVKAYGNMTIHAYKMARPVLALAAESAGLANNYPGDRGICGDPRVLYCESWDRNGGAPPEDWWANTKGTYIIHSPSQWLRSSNGVPFPLNWTNVHYEPTGGVNGSGGLRVHYAPDHLYGTAVPTVDFVKAGYGEQQHLFYRYYIKYGSNFYNSLPCDGGKRPGFAADNVYGGNGGSRVWGYNGWSLRGHYVLNCDRHNPIWPRVVFGTYAYYAQQVSNYGDLWPWTGHADQGLQKLNEWTCVEGETFVNDPGVPNGVARQWIDGRLVLEKKGLYLRGKRPALGYGNWRVPSNVFQEETWKATGYPTLYDPYLKVTQYLVGGPKRTIPDSKLGIRKFWGTLAHGGINPFRKDVDTYYDQTVVATQRIGCLTN